MDNPSRSKNTPLRRYILRSVIDDMPRVDTPRQLRSSASDSFVDVKSKRRRSIQSKRNDNVSYENISSVEPMEDSGLQAPDLKKRIFRRFKSMENAHDSTTFSEYELKMKGKKKRQSIANLTYGGDLSLAEESQDPIQYSNVKKRFQRQISELTDDSDLMWNPESPRRKVAKYLADNQTYFEADNSDNTLPATKSTKNRFQRRSARDSDQLEPQWNPNSPKKKVVNDLSDNKTYFEADNSENSLGATGSTKKRFQRRSARDSDELEPQWNPDSPQRKVAKDLTDDQRHPEADNSENSLGATGSTKKRFERRSTRDYDELEPQWNPDSSRRKGPSPSKKLVDTSSNSPRKVSFGFSSSSEEEFPEVASSGKVTRQAGSTSPRKDLSLRSSPRSVQKSRTEVSSPGRVTRRAGSTTPRKDLSNRSSPRSVQKSRTEVPSPNRVTMRDGSTTPRKDLSIRSSPRSVQKSRTEVPSPIRVTGRAGSTTPRKDLSIRSSPRSVQKSGTEAPKSTSRKSIGNRTYADVSGLAEASDDLIRVGSAQKRFQRRTSEGPSDSEPQWEAKSSSGKAVKSANRRSEDNRTYADVSGLAESSDDSLKLGSARNRFLLRTSEGSDSEPQWELKSSSRTAAKLANRRSEDNKTYADVSGLAETSDNALRVGSAKERFQRRTEESSDSEPQWEPKSSTKKGQISGNVWRRSLSKTPSKSLSIRSSPKGSPKIGMETSRRSVSKSPTKDSSLRMSPRSPNKSGAEASKMSRRSVSKSPRKDSSLRMSRRSVSKSPSKHSSPRSPNKSGVEAAKSANRRSEDNRTYADVSRIAEASVDSLRVGSAKKRFQRRTEESSYTEPQWEPASTSREGEVAGSSGSSSVRSEDENESTKSSTNSKQKRSLMEDVRNSLLGTSLSRSLIEQEVLSRKSSSINRSINASNNFSQIIRDKNQNEIMSVIPEKSKSSPKEPNQSSLDKFALKEQNQSSLEKSILKEQKQSSLERSVLKEQNQSSLQKSPLKDPDQPSLQKSTLEEPSRSSPKKSDQSPKKVKSTVQPTLMEFLQKIEHGKMTDKDLDNFKTYANQPRTMKSILAESKTKKPQFKVPKPKKIKPKTNEKFPNFPLIMNKRLLQTFCRVKISKEAAVAFHEGAGEFFENLVEDLGVILNSKSSNNKLLEQRDVYLLMKELGLVSSWSHLYQIAQDLLPSDVWGEFVPVQYEYNKILPKSYKS